MSRTLWTLMVVMALGGSAAAQPPTHDEFLPGCGRGFGADGQGNALVYAWAEGIDWDGSDGIQSTYISMIHRRSLLERS